MAEFMYDRSLNPESQWYLEWVQAQRELDCYYSHPTSQPEPIRPTVMEIVALSDGVEAEGLGDVELVRRALARWGTPITNRV